jgi:hypothetical protein
MLIMGITHFDGISAMNGFFTGPKGKEVTFLGDGALYTAFYVDGNAGNDANDGRSWNTAVKTIAKGIALADDDIAKTNHWDRRNRLYINGGSYTESLTRFPEKTDIIGVGITDFLAKAKIIGVQVPATAVMGCRWHNIAFQNVTAAETVKLAASNHGAGFYNCDFLGNGTTTVGLKASDCADVTVENCRFYGTGDANLKQLIGIQIAGTTQNTNLRIVGNWINAAVGITIADSNAVSGLIANNYLDVTTLAIDDDSDLCLVVGNRWISAAVVASSYDLAVTKAVDNIATGSDDTKAVPQIEAPV